MFHIKINYQDILKIQSVHVKHKIFANATVGVAVYMQCDKKMKK